MDDSGNVEARTRAYDGAVIGVVANNYSPGVELLQFINSARVWAGCMEIIHRQRQAVPGRLGILFPA